MNFANFKWVLIASSVVGILGSLWSLVLDRFVDINHSTLLSVFFFLAGVGVASLLYWHLLEKVYFIHAFRLYGWGDGEQAVFLRIYAEQVTPHDNTKIISAPGNLPVAPRWDPVKGKMNSVVVCDRVYTK